MAKYPWSGLSDRSAPGSPYAPYDPTALPDHVGPAISIVPIGVASPAGPGRAPFTWDKLADLPGTQTLNHGTKAPVQR